MNYYYTVGSVIINIQIMQILKPKEFDTLSRSQNSWTYRMRQKAREDPAEEDDKQKLKDMPSYKSYGEY